MNGGIERRACDGLENNMIYLLLALSIILATTNNLFLHGYNNRGLRGLGDILLFNFYISCIWIIILFGFNGFTPVSLVTVGWGVLYGCTTALFLLCKMQALASGSVSITSFVGCSSLLVSTAVGVIAFQERVSLLQFIGIIFLMAALFLCISPKAEASKPAWKLWCMLFFLCSGAVGIIFKFHQTSQNASQVNGMMLTASITSALFFALSSVIISQKQEHNLPRVPKSAIPFIICCGITSCGYNRLNISLTGQLPSIVVFPVFNGSVILAASLLSAFIFKEKLSKAQLVALILGMTALMLAAGVGDKLLSLL